MEVLLVLLKKFWPYIVAAAVGAAISGKVVWEVQQFRINSAKRDTAKVEAEFEQYKADQIRMKAEFDRVAEKQRAVASEQFAKLKGDLTDEIVKGDVYRRCVAAGKCGAIRVPVQSGCSASIRLPATGIAAGTGPDAIPVADESAAPQVVNDCAITTLMLNRLQADIEAQPGFFTKEGD